MAIDPRILGARHRLLPEIGDVGLARLGAARVSLDAALSPEAARVARDYLERAGVTVDGEGLARSEDAAVAHLKGAHFALEATARIVGARSEVPGVPLAPLLLAITKDATP